MGVSGQIEAQLSVSVSEKDVENGYRHYLLTKIPDMIFTSPYKCDGYGQSTLTNIKVLTEFKEELELTNKINQVKVLTQTIYYLKKFETNGELLPTTILVGDKKNCFVIHTNDVFKYLSMDFDWTIAPSDAYKNIKLVNELLNDETITPHVFTINNIDDCLFKLKNLTQGVVRLIPITPHNITEVFNYFELNVLGKHNLNTNQLANLFVQILINPDGNYLHPVKKRKTIVTKSFNEVPIKSREVYTSFFKHFQYQYSPKQKEELTAVVDRLILDVTRRKQGEFFTPTLWVNKAHEYITSVYGEDWKDKYVVWDPAWGTGNLTRDYKFKELYVSTLNYSDIQTAEQMGYNPEAVKFQFDFLNDDYDFLPQGLKEAIETGRDIIVLMNPPYSSVQSFENITKGGGKSKNGVEDTNVKKMMNNDNMGYASKNLYSQFIYRILKITNQKSEICMFSPAQYLTGSDNKNIRDYIFKTHMFRTGMLFDSKNFADVKSWGLLFSILQKGEGNNHMFDVDILDTINLDNVNLDIVKTKQKVLYNLDNGRGANLWIRKEIKNIKCEKDLPKLSSALTIKQKGYSNLCEGGMGYFYSNGNNILYNKNNVSYFSSCFSGKSGIPVIKSNILKTFVLFSARVLISGEHATWCNLYDEYMEPNEEHSLYTNFTNDSVVYSLFNSKSQQSSLRQITYKDRLWDIKNEFFWMSKEEMMDLANNANYTELYSDARTDSNRHVYKLLFGQEDIYNNLSPDAKLVLDKASEMVRMSMDIRTHFADDINHLNSWDAGYAQLKLIWKEYFPEEFKEFRQLYKNLEERMRPLVYELGFLIK